MDLTLNEKKLLAVLKPLRDAEEARVEAVKPITETIKSVEVAGKHSIDPLRETLKFLEDTKNLAFQPIKRAIELFEEAAEDTLGPMKEPDAAYLATIMDTTEEAIVSHALLLQDKGLADLIKTATVTRRATEEGEKYRQEGLPERVLFDSFDGAIPMEDLRKHPASKLGIGWLRKKGWVEIKDGMVKKISDAPKGDDEYALADPSADKPGMKELIKRKLAEEIETVTYRISITEEGIALVESGIDLRAEASTLTSDQIRTGEWRNLKLRRYSVKTPPKKIYAGKKHPYQAIIDDMRKILLEMGFTEISGEIVQSSFWNFDALFQPQDHPAREMQDTFFLDLERELPENYNLVKEIHETGGKTSSTGWGGKWKEEKARECVLRTHTTSLSIQLLKDNPEPPLKAFCIGRVYRREAIDPTHTPEFEQLEGVVMDKDVSFRHLMGFLKEFYHRVGFESVRFRPGYFPYTEPSVEPEVWVDGLGWVELGGAGIFREEVTAPWGIKYPILAWGLGVSRVAMLKLGLKDLRELYRSDVDWIRNEPVNRKEVR
ncbi:phenylalanine--tRNA ligase subunit alpha [Methanoplanus endosymbiosus]|uniref:Phenylalanine--tRNA ligase alpha subunit n=1 Tax=Methanoplanus endosymbiosus TaxID=33865 RepID=A0A9E7PK73_9EURY|nr:phenylalanine--tRNA ligase subunit alpha [Methanoplanus endosymbiosus]UUX91534.1 phenylalanine--tRNA ligase subunit alpha [Methanoplanus endosymbiosus]